MATKIYEQFGLEPIINASGSVTRLGGAPMPAAVLEAFCDAAQETVSLEQLQAAASREIARLTGTQAGLICTGASAALTLGTAAILTGFDLQRMERLPQTEGFPNEFVIAREQRNGYDHAVRAAGARLVEVGLNEIVANAGVRRTEVWEYEAAIGPQTAGVLYVYAPHSQPPLKAVVECARRYRLPVLVSRREKLPPRNNLSEIAATGAELVAFSGGKAIRGPQSTGILCGKKDLIASAALQMLDMDDHFELWNPPADWIDKSQLPGMPRHGIGRGMKVSKEEIVALMTAMLLFATGAYDAELQDWRTWLQQIAQALEGKPVGCHIVDRGDGESPPVLVITLDEAQLHKSALSVCRALRNGAPPVYVGHGRLSEGKLVVHPLCLNAERTGILAGRLAEELSV